MIGNYLQKIGLEELANKTDKVKLNSFVEEAFSKTNKNFSDEEIKSLYVYDIPKLSPDGSCSILEEKNDIPYNLADTYRLSFNPLKNDPHTLRLWRLKQITKKLFDLTQVNWLGIYRVIKNPKNESVLVKESYLGIFSRPEFPLTHKFAQKSNNSTVGLTGKAIVIRDVEKHSGTYYKCDSKVQSEFCVPIFDKQNKIIGIIDAEAFPKNFFTDERLLQIAKTAFDLGEKNLGI